MLSTGKDLLKNSKKPIVLIVDDVAKNLQILGNILREENFQIAFATSGEKALSMVKNVIPDLILLDVMMPGIDGFQVCEKLKENEKTKDVPVIFLTAKIESEDILKGFSLGAVDYVTKPFEHSELLARVRTHLELKLSKDVIIEQREDFNELVHILCHDLMNPIGSAKSVIDIIEDATTFKSMKPLLDMAVDNSMEIIELVRKIRALTENKTVLQIDRFNLTHMINQSTQVLSHKTIAKNITIDVDVSDYVDVMVEDVSFINSVLNNLLTNAIKFSYENSTVSIKATLNNDMVDLVITDSGIGMPNILVNNLFDVKAATNRAGTEGESGTGFGMPLVKKFIEAYGGQIIINSRDINECPNDHGTEVLVRLKAAD